MISVDSSFHIAVYVSDGVSPFPVSEEGANCFVTVSGIGKFIAYSSVKPVRDKSLGAFGKEGVRKGGFGGDEKFLQSVSVVFHALPFFPVSVLN